MCGCVNGSKCMSVYYEYVCGGGQVCECVCLNIYVCVNACVLCECVCVYICLSVYVCTCACWGGGQGGIESNDKES